MRSPEITKKKAYQNHQFKKVTLTQMNFSTKIWYLKKFVKETTTHQVSFKTEIQNVRFFSDFWRRFYWAFWRIYVWQIKMMFILGLFKGKNFKLLAKFQTLHSKNFQEFISRKIKDDHASPISKKKNSCDFSDSHLPYTIYRDLLNHFLKIFWWLRRSRIIAFENILASSQFI